MKQFFGAWILNTFYKNKNFKDPIVCRDFRCAERLRDAKTYLNGFLLSGRMQLQDFNVRLT